MTAAWLALWGGRDVPGRYVGAVSWMTPVQIYQQVKEYRRLYPDKALLHTIGADQEQTMAFLMAGGSMLLRGVDDAGQHPPTYEMPLGCEHILSVYEFIRTHLASDLPRMKPLDVVDNTEVVSCLGERGRGYLIYMSKQAARRSIAGIASRGVSPDLTDVPWPVRRESGLA